MNKECLQHQLKFGTPCFEVDAQRQVCSLPFCPVEKYLDREPKAHMWSALHTHCVMSDQYGLQNDFEEGKGEFIRTILELACSR